jgi:hypothetical protein
MVSRVEAAARAYPNHFDLTPPERMDNIRHALHAADNVMFSEEAVEKATGAAYESMRSRMRFPTGIDEAPPGIRQDYETIVRAVIDSLRGT